jgi:addiction module HigA family antidote
MAANHPRYLPDYAIPPGATLLETLEALGIPQAGLARRTGRPLKTINEIIKGKAAITPETALQLEKVLGMPASFWNNRERQYRETLARLEENRRLESELGWLKRLPVKDMVRAGWVRRCTDKLEQLREVLRFFGIASPAQWPELNVLYRRPREFPGKPAALTAWLRRGEIEGQALQCGPYGQKAFQAALTRARRLTRELPSRFRSRLRTECAEAGVAVVLVPQIPGIRAWGATRWLTPRKALLQLKPRYHTNDTFWFTFFHEAGHILLHPKKDVFIEGQKADGGREREADEFARQMLITRA